MVCCLRVERGSVVLQTIDKDSNNHQIDRSVAIKVICKRILDPQFAGPITEAFVNQLEEIRQETPYSSLCFVQGKELPAGTLKISSALVERLHVPASLWVPQQSIIQGPDPQPQERLVIISDVLSRGKTLTQAVEDLKKRYDATTVCILVAHDLNRNKRTTLTVGKTNIAVREAQLPETVQSEMKTGMQKFAAGADLLKVRPLRVPANQESIKEALVRVIRNLAKRVSDHLAVTMVLLPVTCYLIILLMNAAGLVSTSFVNRVYNYIAALSQ